MKIRYLLLIFSLFSFNVHAIGTAACPNNQNTSEATKILKQISEGFSQVAEKCVPAVVSIKATFQNSEQDPYTQDFFHHFFGQMPEITQQPSVGFGSGFFITQDGYILTNNHVVKDACEIKVFLEDGREYEAKVIGSDADTEVALIKVEGQNFPFLKLANSDHVRVGQWAIAIGNPFEFEASVTVGVVSAKGRNTHSNNWENYIQTDAPINPGNSGGPLLNVNGDVIGINTAILSKTGGYMGIGFAIPSNIAEHVADQLLNFGHLQIGYLGIRAQPLTPDLANALSLDSHNGFVIVEVAPGSPAEKAGFEQQDVILAINGKKISHQTNLTHEVSLMKPGSKVKFSVNRSGKEKIINVTIGTYPNQNTPNSPISHVEKLGISVENLTDDYARRLGYENLSGVVVTKVSSRSKLAAASIRPGTLIMAVNREKINSVDEFYEAVSKTPKNKNLLLFVRYGKMSRYVTISLK